MCHRRYRGTGLWERALQGVFGRRVRVEIWGFILGVARSSEGVRRPLVHPKTTLHEVGNRWQPPWGPWQETGKGELSCGA